MTRVGKEIEEGQEAEIVIRLLKKAAKFLSPEALKCVERSPTFENLQHFLSNKSPEFRSNPDFKALLDEVTEYYDPGGEAQAARKRHLEISRQITAVEKELDEAAIALNEVGPDEEAQKRIRNEMARLERQLEELRAQRRQIWD